jgi:predicted glycogen debranching enzyme
MVLVGSPTLGPGSLQELDSAAGLEWLLADGLGGYSSSTPLGLNTRRYHGLLVAATRPPVGRMVLLARVDESMLIGSRRVELSTNAYGEVIHPRGFGQAVAFTLDPLPSLTWELPEGRLTRTVARVHGDPSVVLLYAWEGPGGVRLVVRPLLAYRDHHALQRENSAVRGEGAPRGEDLVFEPYQGCPPLHLRLPGATWEGDGYWYRGFHYERERERGLEASEDLFSPGAFTRPLRPDETVALVARAGPISPGFDPPSAAAAERRRLRELQGGEVGLISALRRAADTFLVRRGETGRTVIAGYHWFADWGRDTMIALPGLCLATGRHREARAILTEYARHIDGGMIPNRFPETGEPPEYNTADAALWMAVAVQRLRETPEGPEFVRSKLKDSVFAILDGYRRGTRHGIRATADGLITQGEADLQLTWMDAKVGDWVVTPRRGKAVEIQALWYNALLVGAEIAAETGDSARADEYTALAARCRESFLRLFWSEDLGYLADVVGGGARDLSLRPNQLYAVGLPHSLLPRDKATRLLAAVRSALLTPMGLRTLAPNDPAYRGRYQGDPASRDGAYHQGTVWPFLMGVYVDAVIRVHGEEGKREARDWIRGFEAHLGEAGLGYVSEIFDGDPPHRPRGAIAQAWSVAELLRVASRLAGKAPAARLARASGAVP